MKQVLHESSRRTTTVRPGSLWQLRDLRLVVLGRAIPFLGDEIAMIGLTVWAYAAGWGAAGVGALLVAGTLPLAFGAPFAGRLVDRTDSRTLTVAAAVWQVGCLLCLAAVTGRLGGDLVERSVIVLLIVLLNCGQAVSGPAWQALVPYAVGAGGAAGPSAGPSAGPGAGADADPDGSLGRAVSAVQVAVALSLILGPALGGVMVTNGGVTGALLADAGCLATVVPIALAVRVRRRPEVDHATGGDGVWAGVTLLRADRVLWPLVQGLVAVAMCVHVVVVVEVFLVRDELRAGPGGYGAVMAVMAAASVAGAAGAGRIAGTLPRARATIGSVGAVSAAVALGGLAPSLTLFALVMAGVGVGSGVLNVVLQALLLQRVPDAVRGRVSAVVAGGVQAATVAGMAVGGALGSLVGPRTIFVGAGCLGLLMSLVGWVRVRGALRSVVTAAEGSVVGALDDGCGVAPSGVRGDAAAPCAPGVPGAGVAPPLQPVAQPFDPDRHHRHQDDHQEHDLDVVAHDRDPAEHPAEQGHPGRPQDRADPGVGQVTATVHLPDTRDDGDERPHDGHESGEHDGPRAVLVEE